MCPPAAMPMAVSYTHLDVYKRQELLCQHLFAQTDLLRIFAEPFGENLASCRVLEKAGFQLEGILRCNAVKNGVVRDMKLYARLRPNGDLAGETDRIATEGRSRG